MFIIFLAQDKNTTQYQGKLQDFIIKKKKNKDLTRMNIIIEVMTYIFKVKRIK